jgi:hypothetical protein
MVDGKKLADARDIMFLSWLTTTNIRIRGGVRRFRLKVAVSRTLGVAVLVALVVAQGCAPAGPSPSESDPPSPPESDPSPPPTTPTPPPSPSPPQFDGTYGPGPFTRTYEACAERYMSPSFVASVEVRNNGTSVTIVDSVRRESTCVNPRPGGNRCTGSGQIADGVPATWYVDIAYLPGATPSITVGEVLSLPCTLAYTAHLRRQ